MNEKANSGFDYKKKVTMTRWGDNYLVKYYKIKTSLSAQLNAVIEMN